MSNCYTDSKFGEIKSIPAEFDKKSIHHITGRRKKKILQIERPVPPVGVVRSGELVFWLHTFFWLAVRLKFGENLKLHQTSYLNWLRQETRRTMLLSVIIDSFWPSSWRSAMNPVRILSKTLTSEHCKVANICVVLSSAISSGTEAI